MLMYAHEKALQRQHINNKLLFTGLALAGAGLLLGGVSSVAAHPGSQEFIVKLCSNKDTGLLAQAIMNGPQFLLDITTKHPINVKALCETVSSGVETCSTALSSLGNLNGHVSFPIGPKPNYLISLGQNTLVSADSLYKAACDAKIKPNITLAVGISVAVLSLAGYLIKKFNPDAADEIFGPKD